MNEEELATARVLAALALGGYEPPPQAARNFLPPLDYEAMRNTRGGGVLLFEGYEGANLQRYIYSVSAGDCLTPDFIAGTTLGWFDPELSVRPGDVGLLSIQPPGMQPHLCLKNFQERNGRLWACSNEGDFPLSECTQVCGRLVMSFQVVESGAIPDEHVKGQ